MNDQYLEAVKEWANQANGVMDRIEKRNEVSVEERPKAANEDEPNDEDFVREGEKEESND